MELYAVLLKTSFGGFITKDNLEVGDSGYLTFETEEEAKQFRINSIAKALEYARTGKRFYEYCRDTDGEPKIYLYTAVKKAMEKEYSPNLIALSFYALRGLDISEYFEIVQI